jgi:cytoskeletal protein CcmA (bactofilin family)
MSFFTQRRPKYGEDPNFVPNTVIGDGVTFRGMIKGKNSVLIQGLVFGDINIDGEVIVTEAGYVKGNITSTFAVVGGIVEGNITLSSYCNLKATASVTGDVTCTAMNMDEGAVLVGVCNMLAKSTAHAKKMKRINEQVAELEAWTPGVANDEDFVEEDLAVEEPVPALCDAETPAMESPDEPIPVFCDAETPDNGIPDAEDAGYAAVDEAAAAFDDADDGDMVDMLFETDADEAAAYELDALPDGDAQNQAHEAEEPKGEGVVE